MFVKEVIIMDVYIEELESRIAPDGGETVLPLSPSPSTNDGGVWLLD